MYIIFQQVKQAIPFTAMLSYNFRDRGYAYSHDKSPVVLVVDVYLSRSGFRPCHIRVLSYLYTWLSRTHYSLTCFVKNCKNGHFRICRVDENCLIVYCCIYTLLDFHGGLQYNLHLMNI